MKNLIRIRDQVAWADRGRSQIGVVTDVYDRPGGGFLAVVERPDGSESLVPTDRLLDPETLTWGI